MYSILLLTTLSCFDYQKLINKINKDQNTESYRIELIQTIKDDAPKYCTWDAKAD